MASNTKSCLTTYCSIGVAVVLVATYLALNAVVIAVAPPTSSGRAPGHRLDHGAHREHGNVALMVAVSLTLFPKLALGMSGFETGVAVMSHVRGRPERPEERPAGRIRNTKKLLTTAA